MTIKIVIFDMDGTLLNTLQDLTDSTNYVLKCFDFPPKTIDEVRSIVGDGVPKLIERAIPSVINNSEYEKCLDLFKKHYESNMFNKTKPYTGIIALLKELKHRNIKIAIVSNKFDSAVKSIAKKYFGTLVDTAVGENEQLGIKKKPAPDSVIAVLKKYNLNPDEALYVGDSDVDILTAKNSSLKCISVGWGYRSKDFLIKNGASVIINRPLDILNFM